MDNKAEDGVAAEAGEAEGVGEVVVWVAGVVVMVEGLGQLVSAAKRLWTGSWEGKHRRQSHSTSMSVVLETPLR